MTKLQLTAKAGVLCWMAGYVLILTWTVAGLIAPVFAYQGYVGRTTRLDEVIVVVLGTAVVALTLPVECRLPSEVAQLFLVLTVAIPVLWLPLLYGPLSGMQVQNLALCATGSFVALWLMLRGGRRSLVPLKVSNITFGLLVATFCAVAVGYLLSLGVAPRVSGFSEVYAQRARFKQGIDTVGAYLVGWLAAGTLPIILSVGLYCRRIPFVVAGIAGIVLLFSLTGYKSYVIGFFILVGTFVMTRRGSTRSWHWVSLLVGAIFAAGLVDRLRGGFEITSLVVRRAISTAGINTAYYVDLLDAGPFYLLRHSVFSIFGSAPYDVPPGRLVGRTFYTDTTAANANFMADGFANFGWWGMIGAGFAVGLFLRFYDRLSLGLPLAVTAPALVFVLLAMANTAILTVVATHGGAVLLGWIALLPASTGIVRRQSADGFQREASLGRWPERPVAQE